MQGSFGCGGVAGSAAGGDMVGVVAGEQEFMDFELCAADGGIAAP